MCCYYDEVYNEFESQYPKWTITGRQVLGFVRVVDCVSQFPFVNTERGVGAIGNSLGGRTSLYIMTFDERVSSGVVSTGCISSTYGMDSFYLGFASLIMLVAGTSVVIIVMFNVQILQTYKIYHVYHI